MNSTRLPSIAAFDMSGLARLKADSRSDPRAALRQAAQQFEAIMLNQMLKSMRETVPDEGVFSSPEGRTFQGLLDQQWVTQMSQRGGLGIADVLERQLGRYLPGAATGGQGAQPPVMPTESLRPAVPPALRQHGQRQDLPAVAADIAAAPAGETALPGLLQRLSPERARFVQAVWPYAQRAAERLGVATELVVAHAALETGWGRHTPGNDSFNLFGIKAGSRWDGRVAASATIEFENGMPQRRQEVFRAYDSMAGAFDDYASLLQRPRYAGVRNTGTDIGAFAGGLQAAGYATDPNYARKLQQVALQLLNRG